MICLLNHRNWALNEETLAGCPRCTTSRQVKVHFILFIFLGFVLFSINCEFLRMYRMKKDWSPLFFDKLTFYCRSVLSFFAGSGKMKKTNLCASVFQRPHTLEKSMSQWNHDEVKSISISYQSHHTIAIKRSLSEPLCDDSSSFL